MARRLEAAATEAGVPAEATPTLRTALLATLEKRAGRFPDEQHPDFLHPARTALVLLHDTQLTEPHALAAALLIDSEDVDLGFDAATAEPLVGSVAATIVGEVPIPATAGDSLAEALVTASEPALLIALVERLDHARHLHLRPTEHWPGFHDQILRVYAPIAERTHPTLARRYRWWTSTFGRRYLGLEG